MENFQRVKKALTNLAKQLDGNDLKLLRARRDWGGGDVVITSHANDSTSGSFYPSPRTVVTQFSKEVSWLFERLRDDFSGLIDGTSKIEFYGRLANAAANYQQHVNGGENAKDILRAVLYE
ncbi:MAG: hypothetical protein ACRD43_11580, partial [Pyrinomonadaceae bacterium]